MDKKKAKKILKGVWYFIWEDDSIWSWLVNVILAFILIKFIVYPGLGLLLSTSHPIVAVVSESMEHKANFDEWWNKNGGWYLEKGIKKEDFLQFSLKNGFNKGDIMVLVGKTPRDVEVGEVIVFMSHRERPRADPIIHRVVAKSENNSRIIFETKGDNNNNQINTCNGDSCTDETDIWEKQVIGKAVLKIPFLGYIKIWFVGILGFLGIK
ncbi:signal peptidase I [Candidatus Woesearchaeota archaeon]|nr:signal peptidase I [Candidatus Woesearchaeota archaeon]